MVAKVLYKELPGAYGVAPADGHFWYKVPQDNLNLLE